MLSKLLALHPAFPSLTRGYVKASGYAVPTGRPRMAQRGRVVDMRSDTVTMPTEEMIMAMREAPVGDDVYGEDPMVNAFEREITYLTGKEAALFCVSATMANALAVRSLLDGSPPHSIICDARAHVYRWEAGNVALLSQASTIPTHAKNGLYVTGEEIEAEAWEKGDVHSAPTRVVSLENTVNGVIMPLEEMARIAKSARAHDRFVHLDGARLWNASVATGHSIAEYAQHVDTIQLCLSKGIGAPVGAALAGSKEVIYRARHMRKLLGGGWRQAGSLAAAASEGLESYEERMEQDHANAQLLWGLARDLGWAISNPVDTNMVWLDGKGMNLNVGQIVSGLEDQGIRVGWMGGDSIRCVLHHQVSTDDIYYTAESLKIAMGQATPVASSKAAS